MGGYGSTRWGWHSKKTQVEECKGISIKTIKHAIRYVEREGVGYRGSLSWTRGNQPGGSISYQVVNSGGRVGVRLDYRLTFWNGEPEDINYLVWLDSTPLVWGGVRWWFTCPLIVNERSCMRRVGKLYLPPSGRYFGCRHCHKLTYEQAQEKGRWGAMYEMLALSMRGEYPDVTSKDLRFMLEGDTYNLKMPEGYFRRILRKGWEEDLFRDPYEKFFSVDDLCNKSGLSRSDLARLESARLLLPDTEDKRYRPKLEGWARKLAYLIGEGWEVDEIQQWAKGRWKTDNPRKWPPVREDWTPHE